MHLACLEKPSNLRSGHFWNAKPRGAAGAARMRMGFVTRCHTCPTRCHRCAPVLLQCLCCPGLQEQPPGLPAALQQDVPYVRMLEMNSLKRFEYCSGFTVEISAPACGETAGQRAGGSGRGQERVRGAGRGQGHSPSVGEDPRLRENPAGMERSPGKMTSAPAARPVRAL